MMQLNETKPLFADEWYQYMVVVIVTIIPKVWNNFKLMIVLYLDNDGTKAKW